MRRLVLIGGCGGAGKETTGRLLLERLERCAWIDAKALVRVRPWEYGEELRQLAARNAALLANSFTAAGYTTVIVSGGLESQAALDTFLGRVEGGATVDYFWLHAGKAVRDRRRRERRRDDADRPEYLDAVDRVFVDPGPLQVRGGCYHRLDTSDRTPEQVVQMVLDILAGG